MSHRSAVSLPALVGALICLTAALPESARAIAEPIPIARVLEGQLSYVAVEGEVLRTNAPLYEIQDETGRLLVMIPDSLTRRDGVPDRGERIRVQGHFGHKQLDDRVRGIRAQALERNRPAPSKAGRTSAAAAPRAVAPAAPSPLAGSPDRSEGQTGEVGFGASPSLPREMVDALSQAADRVQVARSDLAAADAEYARHLADGQSGPDFEAVQARMKHAERTLSTALAGVPELVEAARAAGLSDGVIGLYEQEVYGR